MDYNRLINDQCLSFASRSDGGISVSLAEMPTRPEGKVVMDIGVDETKLVTFDKDKKEWVTRWKSTDNLALVWASLRSLARLVCKRCQKLHAFNPMSYMFFFVRTSCVHKIDCLVFELSVCVSICLCVGPSDLSDTRTHTLMPFDKLRMQGTGRSALMSRFWVCLKHGEGDGDASTVSFGVRDIELMNVKVTVSEGRIFQPRYFALKCDTTDGNFNSIHVYPFDTFQKFLHDGPSGGSLTSEEVCVIKGCKEVKKEGQGNTPATCQCDKCEDGIKMMNAMLD